MTRKEFWMQEFSKAATEISQGVEAEEDNDMSPEDLAGEAAKWADLALKEYGDRF